jgi:DNA-binding CsgD family transcriptional regulator
VGEVLGLLDVNEFRPGLLAALAAAVPADWLSLNDIGPDPAGSYVLVDPPFRREDHEVFAALAHQNPLIARYAETRDGRAYRFSDVVSAKDLRKLDLYREFYGPIGLEYQVAFTLPHVPPRLLGVALSRRDRDFSDGEVALLNRARPFLIQAYRNAIEHTATVAALRRAGEQQLPGPTEAVRGGLAARGLTRREAEAIRLAAGGRSDAVIAAELGISPRTVQKHLQRSFRKLAVASREDAARVVWSLAGA